jgi:hypothetical protein
MKHTGVILAAWSLAAGLLIQGSGPALAALQTLQVVDDLCNQAAKKAEIEARIPRNLLTAISLAESGRWDDRRKASFAWPWTVTNGASATYYPTKEEAIEGVKALRKAGKTNIDVGCMQINLHYHPNAFESIEDAFDPVTNVGYASRFLTNLQKETESWAEAAGRYHSSDPTRLNNYRDKVLGLWERVSGRKQTELGKIEVVKPDAEEADLRRIQQATIQMQFRARLAAERQAPKNGRAMAQLEKFRADRWGPNFRDQSAAVQKAETERRRASDLSDKKQSFEEKRQAQLATWRQNKSGGAFKQ